MEFFRRPQLAGNTLPRVLNAKVRGSIRRADADGSSAVPYFSGVAAAQTLFLSISTQPLGVVVPIVVTLTGNSLQTVMDDIDTALGADGEAVDEDGVLAIRTTVSGGLGFIEVTGGTAAKMLGFDVTGFSIRSKGGDIDYSPQGRIDNKFDTVFPTIGENLTQQALQKTFGRLAGNSDVLFSEVEKGVATLQRVSSFVIGGNGYYVTPAAATRILTGGPAASNTLARLSAASTKEDLAPHFFIMDTVTKQPTASRVVAVTRGVPGGDPAYADATVWSGGGSTGNVLGVDLVKQSGISIVSISEGRVIELAAGLDAAVVVGDLIEIVGATNYTPWDHNGLRWVLDQIIDSTHIVVRPMSKAELSQMGVSVTDKQPIVELNSDKELVETFGTISVHTGYATTNVNLIVRPPLHPSGSYEMWASQPTSSRSKKTWEDSHAAFPVSISPQNNFDTSRNAILSAPTILTNTPAPGFIRVGTYYVRWHGRICNVPQTDINPSNDTTGFVFWDESTCLTNLVATPTTTVFNGTGVSDPLASSLAGLGVLGQPIGYYADVAGTISSVTELTPKDGSAVSSYTVGWGGDFSNLTAALNYISYRASAAGETSLASASTPHYELVLISDVSLPNGVGVNAPGLTVRGVNPTIRLKIEGSIGIALSSTCKFELKNLTIKATGAASIITSGGVVTFDGVSSDVTTDAFGVGNPMRVMATAPESLTIKNCNVVTERGIADFIITTPDITLENSVFTYGVSVGITSSQFFSFGSSASATAAPVNSMTVSKCSFIGYKAGATFPVFNVESGAATPVYTISDSYFSFEAGAVLNSTLFRAAGSKFFMERCVVDSQAGAAPIDVAVDRNGSDVSIVDSFIDVRPQGAFYGVKATRLINSVITCYDSSVGQENNTAVRSDGVVSGCRITGPAKYGIDCTSSDRVDLTNNYINLTVGANTATIIAGISATRDHSRITGNYIVCSFATVKGIYASAARTGLVISGNTILVGSDATAVDLVSPTLSVVSDNVIYTAGASATATGLAVADPVSVSVTGNSISLVNGANVAGKGIVVTTTASGKDLTVTGNKINAYAMIESTSANVKVTATGNTISGHLATLESVSFSDNTVYGSCEFRNASVVDSNSFYQGGLPSSTGGVTLVQTGANALSFSGNRVQSQSGGLSLSNTPFAGEYLTIVGNYISNNTTLSFLGGHVVCNNTLIGTVSLTEGSAGRGSITGNRVGGATTLAFSNASDAKVSFSSNQHSGGLTVTVGTTPNCYLNINACRFLGNVTIPSLETSSGSFSVSNCVIEGDLSGNGTGFISQNNITGNVTTGGSALSISISGNIIDGSLTTVSDGVSDIELVGNSIAGATSVSGSGALKGKVAANNLMSILTIVGGLSSRLMINSTYVNSDFAISAAEIAISECHFKNTSSSSLAATSRLYVSNSTFAADVVAGADSLISESVFNGSLTLTADKVVSVVGTRVVGLTTFVGPGTETDSSLLVSSCYFDSTFSSRSFNRKEFSNSSFISGIQNPNTSTGSSLLSVVGSYFYSISIEYVDPQFVISDCVGSWINCTQDVTKASCIDSCSLTAGHDGVSRNPPIRIRASSEGGLTISNNRLLSDNSSCSLDESTPATYATYAPAIQLGDSPSDVFHRLTIVGNDVEFFDNVATLDTTTTFFTGILLWGVIYGGTITGNTLGRPPTRTVNGNFRTMLFVLDGQTARSSHVALVVGSCASYVNTAGVITNPAMGVSVPNDNFLNGTPQRVGSTNFV